jgi:Tc toxin complex TcA C-terminal TcB-binding domain/Neuraminidase-like domain/Salmonella virulence plasmid 28.1kDa A protein
MNLIQPIHPKAQGPAVANLHACLLFLVHNEPGISDADRGTLERGLASELREQLYKDWTAHLVSLWQEQLKERFGLFVNGNVDQATADALNTLLAELGAPMDGAPDAPPDSEPPTDKPPYKPPQEPPAYAYEVTGFVRLADGSPAPATSVSAFDRDLRSEELLGQSQTDRTGAYRIGYSDAQFRKLESGSADLVVKALAANGSVLAASAVLFNAPPQAVIDLTIPAQLRVPPTLFESIAAALPPLLGGVKVEELEENQQFQDLSFLAGETGFAKRDLARFVLARLLALQALQAEFWFAVLGGSLFEYAEGQSLDAQLATFLGTVPALDAATIRKALNRGFDQKDIPDALRGRVEEWIAAFLKFAAHQAVAATATPTFTQQALVQAGIADPAKQETFALLFNQHQGMTPELVTALQQNPAFTPAEIANLSASFQLADVTGSDFSVIKVIKTAFGVNNPTQIRSLAMKSEDEWVGFIKSQQAAGTITIPISTSQPPGVTGTAQVSAAELYGTAIAHQFSEAFPTAAFTGGLTRAVASGGAHGLQHAQALSGFLQKHDSFDLLTTPVNQFLDTSVSPEFHDLAQDPSFRAELNAAQRLVKLNPAFDATNTLLADGVHSAAMIYRQGAAEFVDRYAGTPGFTVESATLAWKKAADTHAAALTIVGELASLNTEGLPAALSTSTTSVTSFPNWGNLFQSGDLCACEDCRSVLSPAAYFADLLTFLKDRKAKNPASTVKDILFKRRPDLGFIELNCENALTPLPYIDLVCEVLEAVIAAGASDVPLNNFNAMPAVPATAHGAVATALSQHGLSAGPDFSLSQVNPSDPNRWVVHGDETTFLLTKTATSDFSARILCNTKASAAELRAYPAYVDPAAYKTLRGARYPFNLPFDLFAAEVRAGFSKCNLQRWDLMRTLRGPAAPNNPTDGDIAAEYFGISSNAADPIDERRLILSADTDATFAPTQAAWGETGNAAWLAKLANVKTFLIKSGLEFDDLLILLDLTYLNPIDGNSVRDIVLQRPDPSCDTDKMLLAGLDGAHLDRVHRFLRLWRKLGWMMWEVDLVIRHAAIGAGVLDQAFLVNLYYFARLRVRLGGKTSVEQVCALCGKLNTETHFTKLYEKRGDALYQSLFLNKRLINPLDTAFEIDPTTNDTRPVIDPITHASQRYQISDHLPVLLGALHISETDLALLRALTKASDNASYIDGDLTLSNISFLWRHAWLLKQLKLKAQEWAIVLKLFQQDVGEFPNPRAAFEFVEKVDLVKACGFAPDELDWLLAANRDAKAATKEVDAARFLTGLRKDLQAIAKQYDPAQYPFLSPPSQEDSLTALLTSLLQPLGRDEAATQFFVDTLTDQVRIELKVTGMPANFKFVSAITDVIRVGYDPASTALSFTGLMTDGQRHTLLTDTSLPAAVTANTEYLQALDEFHDRPRLALKFFEPVFTAALNQLPPTVDFKTLADPVLALKIAYDAEQRVLRFSGILSKDDKDALDHLSGDLPYGAAVQSLFDQPRAATFPPGQVWLEDNDLLGTTADKLATAINKALGYLTRTSSESLAISQAASKLGLTEALTRYLLTQYIVIHYPPDPPNPPKPPVALLPHLIGPFAASSGGVDYATTAQQTTLDGWYWASRAAALWKKWNIVFADWEKLVALNPGVQLFDLQSLPPKSQPPIPAGWIASLDSLLRTSRLLRIKNSLPETGIAFLDVLTTLAANGYTPATFAADVERLNADWSAADVTALVAALDAAYPKDYLLAETWERLYRAFYFLDSLNAGAGRVLSFAAATMGVAETKTLKELLRSKFGTESWLALSADIQDVLRERKRDALSAYLLTQPMPADAPSGKWENTNDLYAYYLFDVEMCSCQLTSRLVWSSGAVQLFVQRCFMGLERDVAVQPDGATGDSAWRWWTWMRKFQVWVANRKVFLWPENWIAPELKQDRSSFFQDLENELQQNEINQDSAETAFTNYLQKLDGVAQLEIAGFYQEDDGDNAIVHVFGRTKGAEPHLYYYRTYDYRQWTPWEKVDLDIQGDYLVPAAVNKRLFLFWPVFTETPDEAGNSTAAIPSASQTSSQPTKAAKKLRLQLAVSSRQQGKWTPKRVSKDFAESPTYNVEILRNHYRFLLVDQTGVDGRFGITYDGNSTPSSQGPVTAGRGKGERPAPPAPLSGAFEISGCDGVPALASFPFDFSYALRPETESAGDVTTFMKWNELTNRFLGPQGVVEDDFTLQAFAGNGIVGNRPGAIRLGSLTPLLMQTPGLYQMSPPWHLSYLDQLVLDGQANTLSGDLVDFTEFVAPSSTPMGSWLPFFYNDKKRTFFVLPCLPGRRLDTPVRALAGSGAGRNNRIDTVNTAPIYYPQIKHQVTAADSAFEGQIRRAVAGFTLPAAGSPSRQFLEQFLARVFPGEPSSHTDAQLTELFVRYQMRFVHLYLGQIALALFQTRQFHFKNFYHPFVCDFVRLVANPMQSIPGLMRRETQLKDTGFSFRLTYQPTPWVVDPSTETFYPSEIVDFSPDGAYSSYNWELFFHAPLLVANALSRNQRFEEARDWYHFIFNPVGVDSPFPGGSAASKFWITKPFFQTTDPQYVQQRIDNILGMLNGSTDLENQVRDWRDHPFDPHRIANYRTVTYQKTVVMNYLDNLIAWGDFLFRQDSMESINEATQLYVMAAEILGPRPKKIPPQTKPPLKSFNELESEFDAFSNALVQIENLVPQMSGSGSGSGNAPPLPMLYFCVPQNDKMLGYWDTVADRLYKIRHCMNIEGVVRQLALFEPPIDPGALVKAVAAGVDIGSALADLNAPLPLYRFQTLLAKANEVCGDVKALGGALLGALEKKDAEALSLLRQSQEIRVLEATTAVRQKQIEEAEQNLEGLRRSKMTAEERRNFYRDVEKVSDAEKAAMIMNGLGIISETAATIMNATAGAAHLAPTFTFGGAGFGGSPTALANYGGENIADSAFNWAIFLNGLGGILHSGASLISTKAGNDRRWDDWKLQERLAEKELAQMDSQIAAGELRVAIAETELANHLLQVDNAKATDEFMHSKYTNEELYQWQVGQISGVYFQSYKLAYDLAKRAERCFRFELGLQDSSYISFGYWDSLKKGLLSGEKLQYDLRRLESAYLEQNRRELELTKHVSLLLLDPLALVQLRETGRCFFNLPEELFDLDYPGHYFRRFKSVSLTLPCVTGPYTTIACTLRLLKNSIRVNTAKGGGYPRNTDEQGLPADDERFVENNIPVKAIAASSGQNDSGVFELNFRDERYVPFEGGGTISQWSLELFADQAAPDFGKSLRQFDYGTISDAIVHIKYTAREDAGPFKADALAHLSDYFRQAEPAPSLRLFDLRHEFPSQWSRFLNPTNPGNGNIFELEMSPDLFRTLDAGKTLEVDTVSLLARCTGAGVYSATLAPAPLPASPIPLAPSQNVGELRVFALPSQTIAIDPTVPPFTWTITMTHTDSAAPQPPPIDVDDVFLVLRYKWS